MKTRKAIFITLFWLIAANFLAAQKTKPDFLDKANQNSISVELAAISFSYAHKFKKNVTFGISATNGYSFQILLASSPIQYSSDPNDSYNPDTYHFEFLKLQLFYRYEISNRFYFDLGPFASITPPTNDPEWENLFSVGIEVAPYVIAWRFHIGFRLKAALNFDQNSIASRNRFYGLYIIPLVIGFGF
jgi:hypothetical protein